MAPAVAERPSTTVPLLMLGLAELKPSPLNPRQHFDQAKLEELAATMSGDVGVIEPLVARSVNGHYEIIAGERRYRAAKIAKLETVPVVVRPLTDAQALEVMVIENGEREGLNALEEGEGFKRLLKFGYDVDKMAARIHRSRRYIYDRIKLVHDLIPEAKRLVLDERITPAHAVLISRLSAAQQQRILAVKKKPYGGGVESPLFEYEHSLFTPDERDDEQAAKKADPYHGLKVRSVRELEAWIDEHCRLDVVGGKNGDVAPLVQELLPETATKVEEAKKVISITHGHHVHPDAKDGNNQRIYSCVSWKRADGQLKSKTCEKSVTGVIVVGAGRGEAFEVCVNKECNTHWAAERRERERRQKATASGGQSDYQKRLEAEHRKHEEEERRRQARQELFKKAAPVLGQAITEKVKALGLAALGEFIAREVIHRSGSIGKAVAALGKPKTADDYLRVFVAAVALEASTGYWAHHHFPPLAKRLGLDVSAILKKVEAKSEQKAEKVQPAAPARAKKAKAAKKR